MAASCSLNWPPLDRTGNTDLVSPRWTVITKSPSPSLHLHTLHDTINLCRQEKSADLPPPIYCVGRAQAPRAPQVWLAARLSRLGAWGLGAGLSLSAVFAVSVCRYSKKGLSQSFPPQTQDPECHDAARARCRGLAGSVAAQRDLVAIATNPTNPPLLSAQKETRPERERRV